MTLTSVLSLVVWLLASYVVVSALEYSAHRWAMHSRALARLVKSSGLEDVFTSHATLHHGRFFKPGEFTSSRDPAARFISIDLGALYMLSGTVWLWLPLALISVKGAIVLALFIALHGATWSAVHREMHFPRGRWFSRTPVYRFWRSWHELHHERPSTNYNVLLPLWDFVFRTAAAL